MIIDHNHRFIFIAIPKTGSISVQFSLGHNDIPEPDEYHQGIERVLRENPECESYFKFSIVRNPWARLLSLYNDFTLNRICQYSALVKHDKPLFSEFANFEDFCLNVKTSPWWSNIFLKSQVELLSIDGVFKMDLIGRFEQLTDDYRMLYQRLNMSPSLNLSPELLQMNIGKYDNTKYREYYTDKSKLAVSDLYADDIERFGYEF